MALTGNQSAGDSLHVRIISPELDFQSLIVFSSEDTVWQAKQKIISSISKDLKDCLNYGLYCPSVSNRAGKFLDEERCLKDYPLPGPIGLLEFKYKKRLYKMQINPSKLKKLHSPSNLKKFMEIVHKGDSDKITEMVNKGLDPNFCDSGKGEGETPLTAAASLARPRSVMLALVSGGAYLDFRNRKGMTALHVAAELGNRDAIKTLLDLGASPNYKDARGLTPLFNSVAVGTTPAQCVQMLLHDRAEICNQDENGWSEIHHCCLHGRVQHLEHLLFYGADMNARTRTGDTALHICARYNEEECARALMFRGADRTALNTSNEDAASMARLAGHTKLAEIIANFRPEDIVLYTELPKYNEKRRGTISVATIRNLQRSRSNPQLHKLFSNDSNFTASLSSAGGYQMLSNSFLFKNGTSGSTSNLTTYQTDGEPEARTLLLLRDETGFGFVLRGAKSRTGANEKLEFTPTPGCPALQYFDKIEPGSVADAAGLKSGDFLLEVNGENVTRASHEYSVSLIKNSGNQVTIKVVTLNRQMKQQDTVSVQGNRTAGFPSHPPSLSPSTGSQMRSSLAGLAELEKLDATLDQYDNETNGVPIGGQSSPSSNSLYGSVNKDWRRSVSQSYEPLTHGQHRTSLYIGEEDMDYNVQANPKRDSFVVNEPEPDYEAGDSPSNGVNAPIKESEAANEEDDGESSANTSAFALMIKQATLNREKRVRERGSLEVAISDERPPPTPTPTPPPLPPLASAVGVSVSTRSVPSTPPAPPMPPPPPPPPIASTGSPQWSEGGTRPMPTQVRRHLDENRKRDEAHAALMAAVLKRRSLLEDGGGNVGGNQVAESIENRLQKSRKIQVVYRADGQGQTDHSTTLTRSPVNGSTNGFKQTQPTKIQVDGRSGTGRPGGPNYPLESGVYNGKSMTPSYSHFLSVVDADSSTMGHLHGNDDAESTVSSLSSTLSTLSSLSPSSGSSPPSQPTNHLSAKSGNFRQQTTQRGSLIDLSRLPEGVTGITAPLLPPPVEFSEEVDESDEGYNAVPVSATLRTVSRKPMGNSMVFPARIPEHTTTNTTNNNNISNNSRSNGSGSASTFAGKSVESWSIGDVSEFLESLDYGTYKDRFLKMKIDGRRLIQLDDGDLTQLGVEIVLHRIKITREIRKLIQGPSQHRFS